MMELGLTATHGMVFGALVQNSTLAEPSGLATAFLKRAKAVVYLVFRFSCLLIGCQYFDVSTFYSVHNVLKFSLQEGFRNRPSKGYPMYGCAVLAPPPPPPFCPEA